MVPVSLSLSLKHSTITHNNSFCSDALFVKLCHAVNWVNCVSHFSWDLVCYLCLLLEVGLCARKTIINSKGCVDVCVIVYVCMLVYPDTCLQNETFYCFTVIQFNSVMFNLIRFNSFQLALLVWMVNNCYCQSMTINTQHIYIYIIHIYIYIKYVGNLEQLIIEVILSQNF